MKESNNQKIPKVNSLNNGKFLKRAIFSINNQNFKEIEILIIVDDYSIINNANIIKELMEIYSRIIFFLNKENKEYYILK